MTVTLSGTLTCPPERLTALRKALPDHIAATRAEPGCLSFDVTEDPDTPGLFHVAEEFTDAQAFEAHQSRAAASPWAKASKDLPRDYEISGL